MTNTKQDDPFEVVWNHLIFDIFTGKPDSIILPFLKNHFPYLAEKPAPTGWTAYPPDHLPLPKRGLHSLRIDKHPFIATKHIAARLDLFSQEWEEGSPGIERMRVWIFFSSRADAESTINFIIKKFEKVGAVIEHLKSEEQEKTLIKNGTPGEEWKSLSLVLSENPINSNHSIGIFFYDDTGDPW